MIFCVTKIVCMVYVVQAQVSFIEKEKYNITLQVATTKGIIQGRNDITEYGTQFFMYRGIPFAKPPINDLRFRVPQPYKKWKGILNATHEGPACVEVLLRFSGITTTGSEDCLYLNVYTPINPRNAKERLPVIVWIYGGGFQEGNSSTDLYGPQYFMEQKVIIVTFNYRIGIYGFLSTQDEALPGNYGMKDQVAALRWTKQNIQYFGGNPNKITIFGQSAGACAVMYHMISKKSRGLFSGAIAMSGDNLTPWCHQRSPRNVAFDLSYTFGIKTDNTTEVAENLRKMDRDVLKEGQKYLTFVHSLQAFQNGLPFTPTIEPEHEDAFITELSYTCLESGDIAKVPLILGVTSLEFLVFSEIIQLVKPVLMLLDISPSSIPSRMNIASSFKKREVGESIRKKYFRNNSIFSSSDEELLTFLTDMFFNVPIGKTLKLLYKHIPVYYYTFSYKGQAAEELLRNYKLFPLQTVKGVGHIEDLAYLWKLSDSINSTDKEVSDRLIKLWTNFATFRNPTPIKDPLLQNVIWPSVTDPENISYVDIGENLNIYRNYRKEYIQFWEEIFAKYVQKPYDSF